MADIVKGIGMSTNHPKNIFVIQDVVGQIHFLSGSKLCNLKFLCALAPMNYWRERFIGPRGAINAIAAGDSLMTECRDAGLWRDPTEIAFINWNELQIGDWVTDTDKDTFDAHAFVMERNMQTLNMRLSFSWNDESQTGRIERIA